MSTRTKADTVERLRELLSPEHREELLREMTPENRALYERIRKRREEIGLIDFDIVEAIRGIREDGLSASSSVTVHGAATIGARVGSFGNGRQLTRKFSFRHSVCPIRARWPAERRL